MWELNGGKDISSRNEQRTWLSKHGLDMEDTTGWGPIVFDNQEAKYDMMDCARLVRGSLRVGCREKRWGMKEGRDVWQGDLYRASVAQQIRVPWESQRNKRNDTA